MPRPKKYINFQESTPFEDLDKRGEGSGNTRLYVSIECPHCNQTFARIPETLVYANKAMYCKAHLAECEVYNGKPMERKRKRTVDDKLKEMEARFEDRLDERLAEERLKHWATLWARLQLEPPPPTTEEELTRRLEVATGSSKGSSSSNNLFAQISADKSAVQHFKAFLHPDRNGKAPDAAIAVREALLEQLLTATQGTGV